MRCAMFIGVLRLAGCQGVYEGAKVRDESLRTQPERVTAPSGHDVRAVRGGTEEARSSRALIEAKTAIPLRQGKAI